MASNETMEAPASLEPAKLVGILNPVAILHFIIDNASLWIVTGQIFAMAAIVIFAGAHASLERPPSAAPAKPASLASKKKDKKSKTDAGINDILGRALQPMDAVLIPVMASVGLASLYYLLKYLSDPSIISRFMRGEVIFASVASGGVLFSTALELVASAVFPNVWTSRDGRRVYRIDADKRQQSWAAVSSNGSTDIATDKPVWTEDASRSTPFPDSVAWLVPTWLVPTAWSLRSLLRETWPVPLPVTLDFLGDEVEFTVLNIAGIAMTMVVSVLYLCSNMSRPGVLNNLLGISMCFLCLPRVSGTSFFIISTVLLGLFFYDMIMVFYTPMMVSVATGVQAPILIVARSGSRRSMMGLGDIVVPGIFICLCLRYDLYRFYASKIRHVETALETETETLVDGEYVRSVSTTTSTRTIKAAYVDPKGHWGDWLWTGALSRNCSAVAEQLTPGVAASAFPKPFFYMSLASYLCGLFLCNAVVQYTKKGQPALVYLVPLMLLATWGQAAYTGNLKDMWNYTENGSLDTKDVVVDVVGDEEGEESYADGNTNAPPAWEIRARHLRARARRARKLKAQKLRARLRFQRESQRSGFWD